MPLAITPPMNPKTSAAKALNKIVLRVAVATFICHTRMDQFLSDISQRTIHQKAT